jgi:hypothetical protein
MSSGAPELEIGDLSRSADIDSHGRGNVTALVDGRGLTIHGWAFGNERTATAVEVLDERDEVLARVPIALDRPDVVTTVGDLPGAARSGFMVTLEPRRSGTSQLYVRVLFDEGAPAGLGTVDVSAVLDSSPPDRDGSAWLLSENTADRSRVLIGRDGWLFLRGDSNDVLGQQTGRIRFAEADKEAVEKLLRGRRDEIADRGAVWLTAIVPDKEILYAEHLPTEIVPVSRRPVHDYLEIAARCDAPTIYLFDDLCEAKPRGDLYMRTDTHWNHRGAFFAYQAICRELAALGVVLETVDEDSIEWSEVPCQGDLGGKLYPDPVECRDVRATLHPSWGRRTYDNEVRNHGRVLIHEQERDGRPTCLVFGESFAPTLLFFLKESFGRVVFVHTSMLVPELVDLEQPDVVLSLPIERFLIHVPDDSDAMAKLRATVSAKKGELPWQSG